MPEEELDFPVQGAMLDSDAENCWRQAAWIGQLSADDALHSYTTVLIALLRGDSSHSKWFSRYARAAGIDVEGIYASRNFGPATLREIRERQAKGEVASGKTQCTGSAQDIAVKAAELAGTTGSQQLGTRHLIGAYFFNVPSAHEEQIKRWRIEPPREASALIRRIRESHPGELDRWKAWYSSAFGKAPDLDGRDPVPPPRISGFAADTPDGEDQLNVEDDVYALSALVCSTRIKPPLSIGLFGDWGSGKSFFIRQMQKGVSWISANGRGSGRMQKDLPFYKHVVQIEFNAWNYSGGNLWAALVQHILENLKLSPDEGDDLVKMRRDRLQGEMDLQRQARTAAEQSKEDAEQKLNAANEELLMKRDEHVAKVAELQKVVAKDVLATIRLDEKTVQDFDTLRAQLGLAPVQRSAGEVLAALESTRTVLRRFSALLSSVPSEQRWRFLAVSVAVLLAPVLAAVGVGALVGALAPHASSTAAFAAWVSTMLSGGAAWLRRRTQLIDAQLEKVEALHANVRQRVEAEEQRHEAEVAVLEKQIDLARDEIAAAQAHQQEAVARLARMEAQLAATTPASVLADFVRERSQSNDYRRYLGLPAVIRRDFERISQMISAENKRLAKMASISEEAEGIDQRINRIVLYIDDLDRCSDDLVVDVLKAVHLLLAFPLFIVVVAVDARWVSRSLAKRFPGLLTNGDGAMTAGRPPGADCSASPTDYLEKIFQLPFWLQQPNVTVVQTMLQSLMGDGQAAVAGTASTGDGASSGHDRPRTVASTEPAQPPPVFKRRQHDPDAKSLEIQQDEQQFIARLATLLDRSPRSLKRFVNVYRVLKASIPPEEGESFLDEQDGPFGAPFKTVLTLLAVEHGLPAVGEALLDALLAPPQAEALRTLGSVTAQIASERPWLREIDRFTTWLDKEVPQWQNADVASLMPWVPRVARYTYQLHGAAH